MDDGIDSAGYREIAPTVRTRVGLMAFFGVGCCIVAWAALVAVIHGAVVKAVVAVLMLAFVVAFAYRLQGISLTFGRSELIIRNFLRTYRVSRCDIESLRVGALSDTPWKGALWLSLANGSVVPIDAFGRRLPMTARRQVRLEERRTVVQEWLAAS